HPIPIRPTTDYKQLARPIGDIACTIGDIAYPKLIIAYYFVGYKPPPAATWSDSVFGGGPHSNFWSDGNDD
ncbi:hypothetical protein LINPERHAP2_LOCUS8910, partial [Linum perenne]